MQSLVRLDRHDEMLSSVMKKLAKSVIPKETAIYCSAYLRIQQLEIPSVGIELATLCLLFGALTG